MEQNLQKYKMKYTNKILVDCFLKYKNKYLMVRRKPSEEWFPGWYGSIWREVPDKQNPYQILQSLLKELKIKPKKISLKAHTNNVFHDLKETYYVFLYIVEVDEDPKIKELPEGDKIIWIDSKLKTKEKILTEYRKIFPKLKKDKVLFYHTEYDFDKILNLEIYN